MTEKWRERRLTRCKCLAACKCATETFTIEAFIFVSHISIMIVMPTIHEKIRIKFKCDSSISRLRRNKRESITNELPHKTILIMRSTLCIYSSFLPPVNEMLILCVFELAEWLLYVCNANLLPLRVGFAFHSLPFVKYSRNIFAFFLISKFKWKIESTRNGYFM